MLMRSLLIVVAAGFAVACGNRPVPRTVPVQVRQIATEPDQSSSAAHAAPWEFRQGRWPDTVGSKVRVRWAAVLQGPVTRPLAVINGDIIAVAAGSVHRISQRGERLWETSVSADGIPRSLPEGIFVGNRNGVMSVLDPVSGTLAASHGGKDRIVSPPLIIKGQPYWVSLSGDMIGKEGFGLEMVIGPASDAASDGNRIISGTIDGTVAGVTVSGDYWRYQGPGPIIGHPVIADGLVFVPFGASSGRPGGIVALEAETGAHQWTSTIDFEPSASPAIGKHVVVPDKAGNVVALDRKHGGVRWRAPGRGPFTMQPMVLGNAVVAGDSSGRVHSFDMDDGGTIWTLDIESPVTGEGVVVGDSLVVGTANGQLVCIGT